MNELANQWVEENVRPDKDTWLARQAFEAGYSARNGEIEALKDHLDVMIRTNAGHMDAIEELAPKAKAAYAEVNCLSNALMAIRDMQPIGDTPYKYGYAWERCVILAEQAIGRCEYCDGTGDVHRQDGEWLGVCHCKKNEEPPVSR